MQIPRPPFAQDTSTENPKDAVITTLKRSRLLLCAVVIAVLALCGSGVSAQEVHPGQHSLELSRPIRPWEFLPVTGTRAALFGNESGQMEEWIYPLKLFRDFRLIFHEGDHAIPAEVLARTIIVHPESATIVYSSDTFTVRETFFVPVKEQGAVISLDIQTEQPLEIEARFIRDFQLEWPAAIGGTFI